MPHHLWQLSGESGPVMRWGKARRPRYLGGMLHFSFRRLCPLPLRGVDAASPRFAAGRGSRFPYSRTVPAERKGLFPCWTLAADNRERREAFPPYRSRWPSEESRLGLRWEKAALASTFRGLCFSFLGILPLYAVRAASSRFTAGRGRPFSPVPLLSTPCRRWGKSPFPGGFWQRAIAGERCRPCPLTGCRGAVWPLAEIRGKQHFSLRF